MGSQFDAGTSVISEARHALRASVGAAASGWFERGETRVYYETEGIGAPILLLPGLGGSIEDLADVRAFLLGKNFRIIAADLPGSGKSLPDPRTYTATYYSDDAALIADFIKEVGIAPTHMIGFSDGGEVAMLIAAHHPELVRSVLVWGAVGSIHEGVEFDDTEDIAEAYKGILATGGSIWRDLAAEIKPPVMLLAGENEKVAVPDLVRPFKHIIPDAHVLIIQGGDHGLHRSHLSHVTSAIHAFYFYVHAYDKEPEPLSATERLGNTVGNLTASSS